MALPDAGQPEEYTKEEFDELLKTFETDKDALTKKQKAAVARYNFKKTRDQEITFREPGAAPATPAPKPAGGAAAGDEPWWKDQPEDIKALAQRDMASLTKEEKIKVAKAKSQAARAQMEPKETPEDKARKRGLEVQLAKDAVAHWKDVVDVGWQTKWPYVIVKDPARLPDVLQWLRDEKGFHHFNMMTATDYPPDRMEVIYNLYNVDAHEGVGIKVRVPRQPGEEGVLPRVPTVVGVFRGADWYERETFDLFGIEFDGHPDLRRIMLPEGWVGYPFRKDYDMTKEQFVSIGEDGEDVVSFKQEDGW